MKGERLHLMEKLHVSISGCKPPGCQAPQSKALSRVPQKPAPLGARPPVVPETLPQPQVIGCRPPPSNSPGGPTAAFSPEGCAFLPHFRGILKWVLGYPPTDRPWTDWDPTGCSPLAWPEDQCPVAALGHTQEPPKSSSGEETLFTSNSHWMFERGIPHSLPAGEWNCTGHDPLESKGGGFR